MTLYRSWIHSHVRCSAHLHVLCSAHSLALLLHILPGDASCLEGTVPGWLIPTICLGILGTILLGVVISYLFKNRHELCVSRDKPRGKTRDSEKVERNGGGRKVSTTDGKDTDGILNSEDEDDDDDRMEVIGEDEGLVEEDEGLVAEEDEVVMETGGLEEATEGPDEMVEEHENEATSTLPDVEEVARIYPTLPNGQSGSLVIENTTAVKSAEEEDSGQEENVEEGEKEEYHVEDDKPVDEDQSEEGDKREDALAHVESREVETEDAGKEEEEKEEEKEELNERIVLAALEDSLRGTECSSDEEWNSDEEMVVGRRKSKVDGEEEDEEDGKEDKGPEAEGSGENEKRCDENAEKDESENDNQEETVDSPGNAGEEKKEEKEEEADEDEEEPALLDPGTENPAKADETNKDASEEEEVAEEWDSEPDEPELAPEWESEEEEEEVAEEWNSEEETVKSEGENKGKEADAKEEEVAEVRNYEEDAVPNEEAEEYTRGPGSERGETAEKELGTEPENETSKNDDVEERTEDDSFSQSGKG